MVNDFVMEYAKRSDDELLLLACHQASLTSEAAASLDAELRRRNLTKSDQAEYQRFVHRMERREYRSRRPRKLFGVGHFSLLQLFWALVAMGLISFAYLALPNRYHLKPDWEEAAACVTIASVVIAVGWRSLWRDMAFWMALILSSAIQLAVVHAWIQRAGNPLSRGFGKAATLLGLLLWVAIYGIVWLLRRKSQREQKLATPNKEIAMASVENGKQTALTRRLL